MVHHIKPEEMAAIDAYQAVLNQGDCTPEQLQSVANFIVQCLGNISLNEAILAADLTPNDAVSNILDITYCTRGINEKDFFEQIDTTFDQLKVVDFEKLADAEKMTLAYFAQLREVVRLTPLFDKLVRCGMCDVNPKIKSIHEKISQCQEIISSIDAKLTSKSSIFLADAKRLSPSKQLMNYFQQLLNRFVSLSQTLDNLPKNTPK